jgi:hypothetical protein
VFLLAVGCGLGPAPDPATPSGGAGNAPWTDLGPAQICLGDQALAPPSTAPGGLCVLASAIAASCERDADCKSREACVCGRCTLAYCAAASDCAAPRECNFSVHRCDLPCTSTTECGAHAECLAGVCQGRCVDDAGCQHGEFCDITHHCISAECSTDFDCHNGERCEIQRTPRQVLEPAPLAMPGLVLYLDLADPATPDARAIWRATSSDGVSFVLDAQPVLPGAQAPSAVLDGGTVYLYVEQASGIAVATSGDGTSFGAPTGILSGDFHAPSAVHTGGGVVLYYERGGAIGLATGDVGAPLTDAGIVLEPADVDVGDGTPGTAFWLGVNALASPHAIVAGPDGAKSIHLYFAGFGQESSPAVKYGVPTPIPPNFSIGFAAADLGEPATLHRWPYGPVYDHVEALLDHHDELGPAAVDAGDDRYLLYYIDATHAMNTTGPFELGRLYVLGSGRL